MPQSRRFRFGLLSFPVCLTLAVYGQSSRAAKVSLPPPALYRLTAAQARVSCVAFIRRGSLYIKALPDGKPRRLTYHSDAATPVWSPDGRWIAVNRSSERGPNRVDVVSTHSTVIRHIRTARIDKSPAFSFSPDTDEIAWISERGVLFITDLKHGRSRTPTHFPEGYQVYSLAWSPDGRTIAYTEAHNGPLPDSHWIVSLRTIRPDGTHPGRVYQAGRDLSPDAPQWSPDSRYIVFHAIAFHVGSANADGTPLFACRSDGDRPAFPIFSGGYANDVLRDPGFVGFTRHDFGMAVSVGGSRAHVEQKRIAVVDLKTRSIHRLTPPEQAVTYPVWSPNGRHIAYFSAPDLKNPSGEHPSEVSRKQMRVWVMDSDGSHQHRLETAHVNDATPPAWLNDNRHILFERATESGPVGLWQIDIDGRNLRCLVPDSEEFTLWSPPKIPHKRMR